MISTIRFLLSDCNIHLSSFCSFGVFTLIRYTIRFYQLIDNSYARASLYLKADVDANVVEERGEKSGRAKRQKAKKAELG